MSSVAVDHLVIGAATLAAGVDWCERVLGVTPGPGGKHPLMGTHNRLLRIDGEAFPQAYLEILAIDPDAAPPGRRRWFGLDEADLSAGPRLLGWVGRSATLDRHRQGLMAQGLLPGEVLAASRDTPQGTLRWQITVREDGRLLCGGALPTLIQWQGPHPADAMPASGLVLKSLTLCGLPSAVREGLQLRDVGHAPEGSPAVRAMLAGPTGDVTLSMPQP